MTTRKPPKVPAPRSRRVTSPRPAKKHARTFIDDLVDIGRRIPDEEWEKFPRDLAKNFDHYAHGSPREE